jgi:hypothetical protein
MAMSVQEKIDAAVSKAIKETEEKVRKNFQVKRNAEVLGGSTSIKTDGVPDELRNPNKYGGPTAALAMRHAQRRKMAAGG